MRTRTLFIFIVVLASLGALQSAYANSCTDAWASNGCCWSGGSTDGGCSSKGGNIFCGDNHDYSNTFIRCEKDCDSSVTVCDGWESGDGTLCSGQKSALCGKYNCDATYQCHEGICGAECDSNSDCDATECDHLDGCYSGTYRNYADLSNSCSSTCGCQTLSCSVYREVITDADGDGYDTECDGDADDSNANIYPTAPEICDGLDNNQNGPVDEGIDANNNGISDCIEECKDVNTGIYDNGNQKKYTQYRTAAGGTCATIDLQETFYHWTKIDTSNNVDASGNLKTIASIRITGLKTPESGKTTRLGVFIKIDNANNANWGQFSSYDVDNSAHDHLILINQPVRYILIGNVGAETLQIDGIEGLDYLRSTTVYTYINEQPEVLLDLADTTTGASTQSVSVSQQPFEDLVDNRFVLYPEGINEFLFTDSSNTNIASASNQPNFRITFETDSKQYYGDSCYLQDVQYSCPTGYTLNSQTLKCEKPGTSAAQCASQDTFVQATRCEKKSNSFTCQTRTCVFEDNECYAYTIEIPNIQSVQRDAANDNVCCQFPPEEQKCVRDATPSPRVAKSINPGQVCREDISLQWAYCGEYDYYYDLGVFATDEDTVLPVQVFEDVASGTLSYDIWPQCGNDFLDSDKGESCLTCPGDIYLEKDNDYASFAPNNDEIENEQYLSCTTASDCPQDIARLGLLGTPSCNTAADGTTYCAWSGPVIQNTFDGASLRCYTDNECRTRSGETVADWDCKTLTGDTLPSGEQGYCFWARGDATGETPLCVLFESAQQLVYPCKNWADLSCKQKYRGELVRGADTHDGNVVCQPSCTASDESGCVLTTIPNAKNNNLLKEVAAKTVDACACEGSSYSQVNGGQSRYCCPSGYEHSRTNTTTQQGVCCPAGRTSVYDADPLRPEIEPQYYCCPHGQRWVWEFNTGTNQYEGKCGEAPAYACGVRWDTAVCFLGSLLDPFSIPSVFGRCGLEGAFTDYLGSFACILGRFQNLLPVTQAWLGDMLTCGKNHFPNQPIELTVCLVDKGVIGGAQRAVDFVIYVFDLDVLAEEIAEFVDTVAEAANALATGAAQTIEDAVDIGVDIVSGVVDFLFGWL